MEEAKKCTSGTLVASVTPVEPSVSLECAAPLLSDAPTPQTGFCACTGEECDEQNTDQGVNTVLTTINAEAEWSDSRLAITKFPTKNERICFLCASGDAPTRTVVDIAKDAESCSRSGPEAMHRNLTLAENETGYFKCLQGDALSPQADAYKEDCHASQPRDCLSKSRGETGKAYSLTLRKALQTAKTFCYTCSKEPSRPENPADCHVKITTQATTRPQADSPADSPTTSGTATSRRAAVLACGVAFAVSRHLGGPGSSLLLQRSILPRLLVFSFRPILAYVDSSTRGATQALPSWSAQTPAAACVTSQQDNSTSLRLLRSAVYIGLLS